MSTKDNQHLQITTRTTQIHTSLALLSTGITPVPSEVVGLTIAAAGRPNSVDLHVLWIVFIRFY